MDSKTVKLNFLTLGDLENEPISKKKWSVPLRHYPHHPIGKLTEVEKYGKIPISVKYYYNHLMLSSYDFTIVLRAQGYETSSSIT